jgi:hypothetical protein
VEETGTWMLSFGIWDSMACEMDVSVEREKQRGRERERELKSMRLHILGARRGSKGRRKKRKLLLLEHKTG